MKDDYSDDDGNGRQRGQFVKFTLKNKDMYKLP